MDKKVIRKNYLAKRREMSAIDAAAKSNAIFSQITNADRYKNAENIMIYISFQNEADTHMLIKKALSDNKRVIVPVCTDDYDIIPVEITSFDNMKENKYGILEPCEVKPFSGKIDIIIVPGVAFDRFFNRVGFGRGYYDRFLKKHKNSLKVGICYKEQLADGIYADENDVKIDIIVTEEEILVNND